MNGEARLPGDVVDQVVLGVDADKTNSKIGGGPDYTGYRPSGT